MATIKNQGGAAEFDSGSGSSVTFTIPNCVVGDIIVLFQGINWTWPETPGVPTPTGTGITWTARTTKTMLKDLAFNVGYTGEVTSAGTRTITVEDGGRDSGIEVNWYHLDSEWTFVNADNTQGTGTDATSCPAPSLANAQVDDKLFCAWVSDYLFSGTWTVPAAMDAGSTVIADTNSTNSGAQASAYDTITAAGATGTRTATRSTSGDWSSVSLMMRPMITGPTVDAGPDIESHANGAELTRTATSPDTVDSWEWTITAGPTGVGTTIGTAAALAWTPTTAGDYTLQAAATNVDGTGADDFTVTVYEPSATGEYSIFQDDAATTTVGSGSFTLATEFYVTEPETYLVAIRWMRATTGVNPTAARVETVAGSIVAGSELSSLPGSGTGWQRNDLPAPVLLTEGTRYRVLVHYGGTYPSGKAWSPQGRVHGPITAPTNAEAASGSTTTYVSGTSIATPTTTIDAMYWSDAVVEYATSETIPVDGTGTASTTATADLGRVNVLDAGAITADGIATADTVGVRTLDAGTATGDATATADLVRVRAAIAGTAPADTAATADVERLRLLAGTATVDGDAIGNLVDDDALRGIATVAATATGALRTAMPVAGAAPVDTTGTGEGRRVTGFYETLALDFNLTAERLRSRNRIRTNAPVTGEVVSGDVEVVGPLDGFLPVNTTAAASIDRYLAENMMSGEAAAIAKMGARRPRIVVTTAQAYARGLESEGSIGIPHAGIAEAVASAVGDVTVAPARQPAPVDTDATGRLLSVGRHEQVIDVVPEAAASLRVITQLSSVVSVLDTGDPFEPPLEGEGTASDDGVDTMTTYVESSAEPIAEHTFVSRPFRSTRS